MANNTVFDDAYKTLIEKFPSLIIPLINEQFGRNYSEDEAIENLSGELQKPAGDIAADSIFRIKRRIYHVECQSNPDDTMAVRMLEYDFYTAMRNVKKDEKGEYTIEFPKSAVLYLRHNKNTPDEMSVKVKVSNELSFDYKIPIIKAQLYSLEDLLEKKLYILLPFYLLRYEKNKKLIEADENQLQSIVAEYQDLILKLDKVFSNTDTIKRLQIYELERQMKSIVEYVFDKEDNAKNKLGGTIMGGTVMKTIVDEMQELKDAIKANEETIKANEETIKAKDEALAKALAEIEELKKNQK